MFSKRYIVSVFQKTIQAIFILVFEKCYIEVCFFKNTFFNNCMAISLLSTENLRYLLTILFMFCENKKWLIVLS